MKINIVAPLNDLCRGIRRYPKKLIGYSFTCFSIIFTIVKAVSHFVKGAELTGPVVFGAIIVASVGVGLKRVWKPSKIKIKVSNTNTSIEVLFGDIFLQEGIKVIPVNEYFDSALGKPVSEESLHGIFINKCFGGHPQPFNDQVSSDLENVEHEEVSRSGGMSKKYPIGTTALLKAEKDKYLVFALTKVDLVTFMSSADVTMMWIALHDVWKRARAECGGTALNLPLVGGGLSKIGLPTRDLLNLIILSAITETKRMVITQNIRIVLRRDRFEDLDLRDVEQHWKD
jgi:hypothetical protein